MTATTIKGPVPLLAPIDAPAGIMAEARANCAARYRARGQDSEADAFARGDRDDAWAMRHEVSKLKTERGSNGLAPQ